MPPDATVFLITAMCHVKHRFVPALDRSKSTFHIAYYPEIHYRVKSSKTISVQKTRIPLVVPRISLGETPRCTFPSPRKMPYNASCTTKQICRMTAMNILAVALMEFALVYTQTKAITLIALSFGMPAFSTEKDRSIAAWIVLFFHSTVVRMHLTTPSELIFHSSATNIKSFCCGSYHVRQREGSRTSSMCCWQLSLNKSPSLSELSKGGSTWLRRTHCFPKVSTCLLLCVSIKPYTSLQWHAPHHNAYCSF